MKEMPHAAVSVTCLGVHQLIMKHLIPASYPSLYWLKKPNLQAPSALIPCSINLCI